MKLLTLCVICGFLVAQAAAALAATRTTEGKDVDESSDYSNLFDEIVGGIGELFETEEDDSDRSDDDNASGSGKKAFAKNEADNYDLMDINALFRESLEDFESVKQGAIEKFLKSVRDMIEGFLPPEEIKIEEKQPQEQSNSQKNEDSIRGGQAMNVSSTSDKNNPKDPKQSTLEQLDPNAIVGNRTTKEKQPQEQSYLQQKGDSMSGGQPMNVSSTSDKNNPKEPKQSSLEQLDPNAIVGNRTTKEKQPQEQSNLQKKENSMSGGQAMNVSSTSDKNNPKEPKESSLEQLEPSAIVGNSTTQTVTNNNKNNTTSEDNKKKDGQ